MHRRSTSGLSEQIPLESRSGSMGSTVPGKVDAGRAAQRLAVERPARADVVGHVGDGHHQPVAASRVRETCTASSKSRASSPSMVTSGRWRRSRQPDDLLRVHVIGHALRGDQRRRIELVGEPLPRRRWRGSRNRGSPLLPRTPIISPCSAPCASRCEAHLHHLAVARARVARHVDVLRQVAIVRDHPRRLPLRLVDAERELAAPLDDLEHLRRRGGRRGRGWRGRAPRRRRARPCTCCGGTKRSFSRPPSPSRGETNPYPSLLMWMTPVASAPGLRAGAAAVFSRRCRAPSTITAGARREGAGGRDSRFGSPSAFPPLSAFPGRRGRRSGRGLPRAIPRGRGARVGAAPVRAGAGLRAV